MSAIPKLYQLVKYNNHIYQLIHCDMDGKCKLKKALLPNKGRVIKGVDISEITK
jgi:hypothetical protein